MTKDVWLPTEAELTVEEVPLGTPSLRAGAMHLGKVCEVQNNEFMLCRSETQDPRWVDTDGLQTSHFERYSVPVTSNQYTNQTTQQ